MRKSKKSAKPDFHTLYKQGKLEEEWDFIDWAGLYEMKLDREQEYQKPSKTAIKHLPLKDSKTFRRFSSAG